MWCSSRFSFGTHFVSSLHFTDVKKFNLSYHFYADNSQLYLSFQPTIPGDRDLAVSNIERCVLEIDNWMLVNRLKLNKDKTEILVTYLC